MKSLSISWPLWLTLCLLMTFYGMGQVKTTKTFSRTSQNSGSTPTIQSGNLTTATYVNGTTISPEGQCEFTNLTCMYVNQKERVKLYLSKINYRFIYLSKWNGTDEMLLFGSIFNPIKTKADFFLLQQIKEQYFNMRQYEREETNIGYSNMTYRVVIQIDRFQGNATSVWLNNANYSINLNNNFTEYLIPDSFEYVTGEEPLMKVPNELEANIENSYLMICVNFQNMSRTKCSIVVKGLQVDCYCTITELRGYIVVLFELLLIMLVFIFILLLSICSSEDQNPEVQFNINLCMVGQSKFDYLAIFRIGPVTDGFDFETSYIDLQLLTQDDQQVGIPVRFSCCKMPDQMSCELHMVVCRISPLPPITAVRANHSDITNLMYFHDFTVIDLRENNRVMQEHTISQFITSEPAIFRPLSNEQNTVDIKKTITKQNSIDTNYPWLPLISAWSLTLGEKIIISILISGFVSATVMAARVHLHWYEHWKDVTKSVVQFVICLFAVSAVSIAIIFLVVIFYARRIKRPYLIECFEQMTSDKSQILFSTIRYTFLLFVATIGVALSCLSVYWGLWLDITSAFIWSGINLSALALTTGAWLSVQDYLLISMKTIKSKHDYTAMLRDNLIGTSSFHSRSSNRSIFNSLPSSSEGKGQASMVSNYGPTLTNPNLISNLKIVSSQKETDLYKQFIKSRHEMGKFYLEPIIENNDTANQNALVKSAIKMHHHSMDTLKNRNSDSVPSPNKQPILHAREQQKKHH